jgi:hypothetical protein
MLKNTLILIVLATSQLFFSQTKVTICWDASQSMIDRDIKKEFDFLNNYFKFVSDAEVTLITFSNDISGVKSFSIEKGQWNDLKEAIEDIRLDGATS